MPHKWEQIGETHTFENGETLTYYHCTICNRHKKEGSAQGGWVMYEGDTEGMGDLGCLPEPPAGYTKKHEWTYMYLGREKCTHCLNRRKKDHNGDYVYMCENGVDWGPEQPQCIYRKMPDQEAGRNG